MGALKESACVDCGTQTVHDNSMELFALRRGAVATWRFWPVQFEGLAPHRGAAHLMVPPRRPPGRPQGRTCARMSMPQSVKMLRDPTTKSKRIPSTTTIIATRMR